MRPSAELRPPGVYAAMAEPTIAPLQIAETHIVGFVGMAQKGPIDEPRRISSWEEFLDIYGYTSNHYLSDSVEAFFRNEGRVCYVVRVAHVPRDGEPATVDHAMAAQREIPDDWNKPALRVRALNEGRWGNSIWVGFGHSSGARSLLTRDLDVGSGVAQVSSTRGFEVGALVRIFDRDNDDYVVLTEVGEREIMWGAETPVNRKHRAAAPTHLEVISFEMQVALRDRREVFKNLQMHPSSRNYAPRVINASSRLVVLEDLQTRSPPPHHMPEPEQLGKISGGRNGTEKITPEDFIGYDHGPGERSGLMSLVEVTEVALLACPDAMGFLDADPGPGGELRAQRVQDAMVDLAENLKDRFVILDCPRTRDIEVVQRWRRRTDSSYCAYYWPWIEMPSQEGSTKEIPPSGVMSGIYASRDLEIGVHQAPANVPIIGAVDLSVRVTEDHLGLLNAEGINSFRISRGIRPWGARTASSDPDWRYLNVRRIFIMLRRSLESGMGWIPFEPNDHKTWASVQSMTTAFLRGLYQLGMFAGGNPDDAFYVKCDAETNPPEVVAEGRLICSIGIAPVIPAEYISIQITQNMSSGE